MIPLPLWITNYKTYPQTIGIQGQNLTKTHDQIAVDNNLNVAVVPNLIELTQHLKTQKCLVIAPHLDEKNLGGHTGSIPAEIIAQQNITTVLLNHSENRVPQTQIKPILERAFANRLNVILCAESIQEVQTFSELYTSLDKPSDDKPNFAIAYEPPELIGSSENSVSRSQPEVISQAVRITGAIPLMIGAGVNSLEDVQIGLKLGAQGFLVASAICKASDSSQKLVELTAPMSPYSSR